MNRPALKKILHALGKLATLAAVCYLLVTLFENANRITITFSMVLPVAVALLCTTHCIQARIIQSLLDTPTDFTAVLNIHCTSQVYKYVPGNIAHYFSRWFLLQRLGVRPGDNARLIVHETLLLIATFSLFGIAFLAISPWIYRSVLLPGSEVLVVVGMVALSVAGYVFRKKIAPVFNLRNAVVMLLYGLAGLVSGLVLLLLGAYMVPDIEGIGFAQYTLGFAVSFLAGFVVPGSPGGIGIREFVFVELFRHGGTAAYLLTQLIVLYRLLAIAAELLMYCIARVFVRGAL